MRPRQKPHASRTKRVDAIRRGLDRAQSELDRGRLDVARGALARVGTTLDLASGLRGPRAALLHCRSALLWATLARRRGTLADAEFYLARAGTRLREAGGGGAGTQAAELEAAIVHLQADLAISRGAYESARRLLSGRLEAAPDLPRRWAVTFRRSLGAIETRRGRPSAGAVAYRLALDALPPRADRSEEAALRANLAMTLHMQGDAAAARSEAARALALRSGRGIALRDRANTTALMALVTEGEAADHWDEALAMAEAAGDLTLAVEVRLLAARHAARGADVARARWLAERGASAAAALVRQEPTLRALGLEVAGSIAAAARQGELARREWFEARRQYADLDAAYHVARLDAELAALAAAAEGEEAGRAEWILATRSANRNGFRLPRAFDALARRFRDANVECERYARRHGLDGPRQGAEVLIERRSGVVRVFGQPHSLGARSVTFRVLVAVARAGARGLTPRALCRGVWGRGVASEAALVSRLRFQVHRLRGILGSSAEFILCVERAGSESRYIWNAAVRVRWEAGASGQRSEDVAPEAKSRD
jgi:hypothetical protein